MCVYIYEGRSKVYKLPTGRGAIAENLYCNEILPLLINMEKKLPDFSLNFLAGKAHTMVLGVKQI